ncbi:hypothetical protein FG384_07915 [Psychrobacillus vulpis]|uniref:Uncharacterized protein n=1 Tax=Psychrobacillus vulpis TaxID=2325572 RepID=A0A544TSD6_9BACI|nr:hypothetical protein FG384_07915 [Psychrobacillus vulpis]
MLRACFDQSFFKTCFFYLFIYLTNCLYPVFLEWHLHICSKIRKYKNLVCHDTVLIAECLQLSL